MNRTEQVEKFIKSIDIMTMGNFQLSYLESVDATAFKMPQYHSHIFEIWRKSPYDERMLQCGVCMTTFNANRNRQSDQKIVYTLFTRAKLVSDFKQDASSPLEIFTEGDVSLSYQLMRFIWNSKPILLKIKGSKIEEQVFVATGYNGDKKNSINDLFRKQAS